MLHLLDRSQYGNLKHWFKRPEYSRASAVVHLNRDGEIYSDSNRDPELVFVNTTNFSYIDGDISRLKANGDFKTAFDGVYLKDKTTNKRVIKIVTPDEEWVPAVKDVVKDKSPYIMPYLAYQCDKMTYDWKSRLPEDLKMVEFDSELIDNSPDEKIQDAKGLIERCYWNSREKFFENSGGVCLMKGDTIVSYSFMFYNRGDDSYELSIVTDKDHRLRGFGALTTAACAELALSRAAIVRWVCKARNEGSYRTAEKVGFKGIRAHDIIFMDLKGSETK